MANLSVEEPDALMCARPDLWEPRVGNDPGPPGPKRVTTGNRIPTLMSNLRDSTKSLVRSCHAHEWHLDLAKPFQNIAFELMPGFHHSIVFLLPAFPLARFEPIGSVGNSMGSDCVE